MGEWEELVEAHGYLASDPDALDNMMGEWEMDKKSFQKNKSTISSSISKIRFNNFSNHSAPNRDIRFSL